MPEHYEVRIRKEALKFASCHMTVFPDGSKEALHGHQYVPTVTLGLKSARFQDMVPFSRVKEAMKKISNLWDERVLLATENPFLENLTQKGQEIEFRLCGKRYVLPSDEVVLLKLDNISCENLAQAYLEFMRAELDEILEAPSVISYLSVYIEESPGQGAVCTDELG